MRTWSPVLVCAIMILIPHIRTVIVDSNALCVLEKSTNFELFFTRTHPHTLTPSHPHSPAISDYIPLHPASSDQWFHLYRHLHRLQWQSSSLLHVVPHCSWHQPHYAAQRGGRGGGKDHRTLPQPVRADPGSFATRGCWRVQVHCRQLCWI